MRIAREEIFGPVLSVLKVRDLDEAIEVANGTDYALTGGFFSRSPANIERVKAQLEAGNVYINRPCTGAIVGRHPFGGFKMSGSGTKAGGEDYLLNFLLRKKRPNTTTNFFGQKDSRTDVVPAGKGESLLVYRTTPAQQFHDCHHHVQHRPRRGQNNQRKHRHFPGSFPCSLDTEFAS
jgi:delta 1-pyrroline-5-carboxylate dehydrogenase